MQVSDLEYTPLSALLKKYDGKGRRESANFLNWFLENIYRLDATAADDAICDESNDKGIDGIYVDHNTEEIHFFQAKISQSSNSSIGDSAIKQLVGSVQQFDTAEKIRTLATGNANSELKAIINRNDIANLVDKGYRLRPVFIANLERDHNTLEIENLFSDLLIFSSTDICQNYIEFEATEGINSTFAFDTSYTGVIELQIDQSTKAYLLPVSATELVKLSGISDGTLFSQNVRYSLGNTPVNKAIAQSIADIAEHKNFSLYHNGVTLICSNANFDSDKETLTVKDYVVVNGAQSITTFYHNSAKLSEDLRIFVKIISLDSQELSRRITHNSNNQNAIKPRDLRSNHDLMLRLKTEFDQVKSEYQFEIKRGQPVEEGREIISNEEAGRQLLAFDLDEPYSCHQIYRVFDEKYADIFGRREVTYGRVIFVYELTRIVNDALSELDAKPIARYALTKFFLLNVLGHIIRLFSGGRDFLADTQKVNNPSERKNILQISREIAEALVVDLNYEIEAAGVSFDYKRDFKSPEAVKDWRLKLLRSFEKDFRRKKVTGFGPELDRGS